MNSTDREKFLLEALETKDPGRPPPLFGYLECRIGSIKK